MLLHAIKADEDSRAASTDASGKAGSKGGPGKEVDGASTFAGSAMATRRAVGKKLRLSEY